MKTFIKELVYNGCKEDFIEDKISSSIAINFNVFVSLFAALVVTGVYLLLDGVSVPYNTFVFFITVFIGFMVVMYSPGFHFQSKCLTNAKVSRPFYFIMELENDKIELKVDFDKDHRRTNKQYKINLNTVEGVGIYTKQLALSEDRFINNGDFVRVEDNPNVEFIKIDTNKVGSLSNIGNRKLSYIIPRYDDNGVDMLVELYGLLEK